jgi:hypothetical protein
MIFNSKRLGPERLIPEDLRYEGSRFADVRAAVLDNPYYLVWGAPGAPPLPVYSVRLRYALRGLLQRRWQFQAASDRAVDSRADLRWGPDRLGFRRILHANGVCLIGKWTIDGPETSPYSGYFGPGSRGLVVARYSVCCTETRRDRYRSLSMVGKLFPTVDPNDPATLKPASFITQEDLGGSKSHRISDVELRNAPDVTPWRRGSALGVFLVTALVLRRTDVKTTIRQLYEIAGLGVPKGGTIATPTFMRLVTDPADGGDDHPDLDFRDEILGRIYDRGNPTPNRTLTFHVEVSDTGTRRGLVRLRRDITNWRRIGRIEFNEAVASYNGDFVLHYPHPAWRTDPARPSSVVRNPRREARERAW